jgi:acyl carrier protein
VGLEGLEIIMEVEEEFRMVIPEADASEFDTVGKLVDYVYDRLRKTTKEPCPTQQGFYILRQNFVSKYGYPRNQIQLDTKVDTIIPKENRREEWREFIEPLLKDKNYLPPLSRPLWLDITVKIITLVSVLATFVLLFIPATNVFDFLIVLGVTISVNLLARLVLIPFKTVIPSNLTYVTDLIALIKTTDSKVWSKEEVFEKIKKISIGVLYYVDPKDITLDAHWIDDLAVGC